MNDDYDTTDTSWLRKFNSPNYAKFIFIFIIIIVIVFIINWRYIRPKWYKKIH